MLFATRVSAHAFMTGSIKTFIAADAQSVRLKYSSEAAVPGDILNETSQYLQYRPHPTDSDQVIQMITVTRTVLRKDLETLTFLVQMSAFGLTPTGPMSTKVPASTTVPP